MLKKMGTADRVVRIVIASAVTALYFAGQITGTAALILGALALIFLVSNSFGFSPLYAPVKLTTCSDDLTRRHT